MLFSATDGQLPVGLGVSGAYSELVHALTQLFSGIGRHAVEFDLCAGSSHALEQSALSGKLAAVIELGLEDYIREVASGHAVSSNRLTGAIQAHLPQVWVLLSPSGTCSTIKEDVLDAAGKRLAWLASAADPHPTVIVVDGNALTDILAESFSLWALASVPVHRLAATPNHELAANILKCLG